MIVPRIIIHILSFAEVMFKAMNKMVAHQVDKKTQKLEEEEEHKEMVAYLKGHGHDRAHSQILLGTYLFNASSWPGSHEQVEELLRLG
jgi:hypothetical protein